MTDTQTADTNGAPKPAKEPSLVAKIRDEWEKAGAKVAPKTSIKPVLDTWRASQKELAAAQAAAVAASEKGYKAAAELAKMVGCGPLQFDGALHEFSSRDDKVFLRVKGDRKSAIEL